MTNGHGRSSAIISTIKLPHRNSGELTIRNSRTAASGADKKCHLTLMTNDMAQVDTGDGVLMRHSADYNRNLI